MYHITDDQFRSVVRLCDAARLLDAALPATHTTTPLGPLRGLTDDLGWLVFIQQSPDPQPVEA